MAQGGSRQRKKKRRRQRGAGDPAVAREPAAAVPEGESGGQAAMERGYSRSRRKDEEARAKLQPLRPGQRPTAVTVGSVVALLLALANLVALLVNYDPDEPRKTVGTAFVTGLLLVVAAGMWRAKYWAVLGMQTLLALTIVGAAVGAATAVNLNAVVLVVALIVPAAVLFWFLVKAMARIQMPSWPTARR